MKVRLFVAMKGLVEHNGKLLILKESKKYADRSDVKIEPYDVPGGRLEDGEHFLEALHREIYEETGLECEIGDPIAVNQWTPIVRGEQWQIVGIFFKCKAFSDAVQLSDDHDEYQWMKPSEFDKYEIKPTNLPAFKAFLGD